MHMADALISPQVGGTFWVASAATIVYCSRKLRRAQDERLVPLMGVLGAFIFAAQMINFAIPGTGSSGHLGGAVLLSVLLGPYAAFLVIASVLIVQALFFADGGLLALGCNIFNLGVLPAFIAYPVVYRPLHALFPSSIGQRLAVVATAVFALQLGSFAVVLQTSLSGLAALPFAAFAALMQPVHLAIGLVEGMASATVIAYVHRVHPGFTSAVQSVGIGGNYRRLLVTAAVVALLTGGVVSWYASVQPDGLEWSIARLVGTDKLQGVQSGTHHLFSSLQERIALLPDYDFRSMSHSAASHQPPRWGVSVSGIVGGLITLLLVFAVGRFVRKSAAGGR